MTMTTPAHAPAARLRPARPEDLPAVAALLTESGLPLDGVADALPAFVVAEHDGEIVGVAGLEPCGGDALLRSVAVAPAWRARGLGRRLVAQVIEDAASRRVRALFLLTLTAERWFPRFGFAAVEREDVPEGVRATGEFRHACPASATVMTKSLNAP